MTSKIRNINWISKVSYIQIARPEINICLLFYALCLSLSLLSKTLSLPIILMHSPSKLGVVVHLMRCCCFIQFNFFVCSYSGQIVNEVTICPNCIHKTLTLSACMLYWTSWPDNTGAIAFNSIM